MISRIVLFILGLSGQTLLMAQTEITPETFETKAEQIAEENEIEDDDLIFVPDLEQLRRSPINLNKCDVGELLTSGLFTLHQAEMLTVHIKQCGWLLDVEELQAIDGFDVSFIRFISPFIMISDASSILHLSFRGVVANGDHTIVMRGTTILEKSRGFADEGINHYPGTRMAMQLRYRFNFRNKLKFGITLENDAGESLFTRSNKIDFASFYLYGSLNKLVHRLAIGDFSVMYGQGLVINSAGRSGSPVSATDLMFSGTGILPYTSVNESAYLRGLAVSLNFNKVITDVFVSHKKIDGNVAFGNDQLTPVYFTSILQSGLHRTPGELQDRRSVAEFLTGIHSSILVSKLKIGLSALAGKYDLPLILDRKPYNRYYPSGSGFYKTGMDMNFRIRNVYMFGELATSDLESYSGLAGCLVQLDKKMSWSLQVRKYARSFNDRFTAVNASGGSARNEMGLFSGFTFKPGIRWELSCMMNHYSNEWLRYSTSAPGSGSGYIFSIFYRPDRSREIYFRYKLNHKESNSPDAQKNEMLTDVAGHHYRFQYQIQLKQKIKLRTRVEWSSIYSNNFSEKGVMAFQDLIYKPLMKPYSLTFRYVMFNTDSYQTRIYAYENDVLYSYSIPAYYYQGYRYYVLLRYKIRSGLDLWIRYARTRYFNRNSVGSGYDEIPGNKKTEFKCQLRILF